MDKETVIKNKARQFTEQSFRSSESRGTVITESKLFWYSTLLFFKYLIMCYLYFFLCYIYIVLDTNT
jgi:hypothetical protein